MIFGERVGVRFGVAVAVIVRVTVTATMTIPCSMGVRSWEFGLEVGVQGGRRVRSRITLCLRWVRRDRLSGCLYRIGWKIMASVESRPGYSVVERIDGCHVVLAFLLCSFPLTFAHYPYLQVRIHRIIEAIMYMHRSPSPSPRHHIIQTITNLKRMRTPML